VIDADDPPQVLRIQPRRQRSRSHEVAEHDGELPALSAILSGLFDGGHRRRRAVHGGGRRASAKFADRPQHLSAVTEYHTEFFQVLIRQVAKNREINSVFNKALNVLGHAELFEPVPNLLHHCSPGRHRGLTEPSGPR